MADSPLSQAEADALLALPKKRLESKEWQFPGPIPSVRIPLTSTDGSERFVLDLYRGRVNVLKRTQQTRGRQVVILARLDLAGAPHRNPDGTEIPCPHLHVYREGYEDKWAVPVPPDKFSNLDNPQRTLEEFMAYCNIVEPPVINPGVFT